MKINFGKHKGLTLEEISVEDPSYLIWLHKETDIEVPSNLVISASDSLMEPDVDYFDKD